MEHINRMLDRMIATDPTQRLKDAGEVLNATRRVERFVRLDFNAPSSRVPQICTYCGQGMYQVIGRGAGSAVSNFGLRMVGAPDWLILVCQTCGHVQLFRVDAAGRSDWWSS